MYDLPCEWNFRETLCVAGEYRCLNAGVYGVSLLHGNIASTMEERSFFKVRPLCPPHPHLIYAKVTVGTRPMLEGAQ